MIAFARDRIREGFSLELDKGLLWQGQLCMPESIKAQGGSGTNIGPWFAFFYTSIKT